MDGPGEGGGRKGNKMGAEGEERRGGVVEVMRGVEEKGKGGKFR